MDNKKIGLFIAELRKEKGLSQYDLAEMIPITREAVSRWERGKSKPSKDSLEILSKIFNVSIEELLLGRRNSNSKNDKENVVLDLYEDNTKKQKMVKRLFLVLMMTIVLFLGSYFFNNYNTINIYTIKFSNDNIVISNGILVSTKDKIYFRLGDVETDEYEIESLSLFYKDAKDNIHFIYKTDSSNIVLYDYYSYNEYFDYYEMKEITKNLYLEIEYTEFSETVKLELKKDFSNNFIFTKSNIPISYDDNNIFPKENEASEIEKIIKSKFTLNDDMYIYEDKENDRFYIYDDTAHFINILENNSNYSREWIYYFNGNYLIYQEYNETKIIKSFDCSLNECEEHNSEIEYFNNELLKILK